MFYLESYKDFVGSGSFHIVTEIDDNWVLKMPLSAKDNNQGHETMKEILSRFDYDISIMNKYTDIFPKVKRLSKNRVAVERLNTDLATKEFNHVFDFVKKSLPSKSLSLINDWNFINYMIDNNSLSLLNKGDSICKRWYKFLSKVCNYGIADEVGIELDFNMYNFGIDSSGKLKLIDF